MRKLKTDMHTLTCDAAGLAPTTDPLIDTWPTAPAAVAAKRLAAVGLGDPFSWCRTPDQLSVGQNERFNLCRLLHERSTPIIADEWLNGLDRTTAIAVAWATGRELRKQGRGAILACCEDDIAADLSPDLHIRVGWTPELELIPKTHEAPCCSLLDTLVYRRGDVRDWRALCHLHYAAGDPATVHSYHVLELPNSTAPAGVALLSYPDLHSAARNLATDDAYRLAGDRRTAQRLNREVLKLSRMVVTPELRGCGLATRLMMDILGSIEVRYVECVTALGRYSGWLERSGFRELPTTSADIESELMDFAAREQAPPAALLDPVTLQSWADSLSVRRAREARRLVWLHYHHFVLHRRTRRAKPKVIPGPTDARWPQAWDVAARRLIDRPGYWIIGPIDPMTGRPSE